jgi:hypothetical protein
MAGERIQSAGFDTYGMIGDRSWAAINTDTGDVGWGKSYPKLMNLKARYTQEPPPTRGYGEDVPRVGADPIATADGESFFFEPQTHDEFAAGRRRQRGPGVLIRDDSEWIGDGIDGGAKQCQIAKVHQTVTVQIGALIVAEKCALHHRNVGPVDKAITIEVGIRCIQMETRGGQRRDGEQQSQEG